jgi:ribose/xylose/arabinose/galactoside ABC-type transport system permease subunit
MILALVIAVGVIEAPDFLTQYNVTSVLSSMMAPLVVALGASVALYAGIADLSIGSTVGLSAMVVAVMCNTTGNAWLAVLVALTVGLAVGIANGVAVVTFGAEALVATIGSLAALRGVVLLLGNEQSQIALVPGLERVVSWTIGPLPTLFVVIVTCFGAVAMFLSRSRLGRHIQATGGNVQSAVQAGISANRIRRAVLVGTAMSATVGGLIYVGQLDAAPVTLGTGMELQIYAAILISGFSLTGGGIGNPMVTVAGIAVLSILTNILNLANVVSSWQNVLTGGLLAFAVTLDLVRRRRLTSR